MRTDTEVTMQTSITATITSDNEDYYFAKLEQEFYNGDLGKTIGDHLGLLLTL